MNEGPFPLDHLVLAYVRQSAGAPLSEIAGFRRCEPLGCCVYEGRSYNPADPADMDDLALAQQAVGRSSRVHAKRVRTLPVRYFLRDYEAQIAEQAQIAEVVVADRQEGQRLAELAAIAAEAPETPPEADPRLDDFQETETPDEIPPYAEWTVADLRAEAERRELDPPEKKTKAAWIAVLEAAAAADGVETP